MRRRIGLLLLIVGVFLVLTPLLGKGYSSYTQFMLHREIAQENIPPLAEDQEEKRQLEGTLCIKPPFTLSIPALSLEVVVVEGSGGESLRKGPGVDSRGVYPGMPGNVVIAAHRNVYGAWFKDLDQLKAGDEIMISSGGYKISYRVENIYTVQGDDLSVLEPDTGSTLTLITCELPVSSGQRIVARAVPVTP